MTARLLLGYMQHTTQKASTVDTTSKAKIRRQGQDLFRFSTHSAAYSHVFENHHGEPIVKFENFSLHHNVRAAQK
jgi:hypothetical protein